MAMYEELCFLDLISPIQDWLDSDTYWINEEGLIEGKIKVSHKSPWLHAKQDPDRNCNIWATVMFSRYGIIPRACMNCWKVSTNPRTFKEAREMLEFQKELGYFSKTGMEQRSYSGRYGGWSSFWYCPLDAGLKGARELHATIEKAVHEKFDEGLKVVLKRACTEMEMRAGPSDRWQYTIENEIKEELIRAAFAPQMNVDPPALVKVNIERRWIEWAMAHTKVTGDMTYLEYTNADPVFSMVNYNGSIHSQKDFEPIKEMANDRNQGFECSGCEGSCPKDCSCSRGSKGGDGSEPAQGILLV